MKCRHYIKIVTDIWMIIIIRSCCRLSTMSVWFCWLKLGTAVPNVLGKCGVDDSHRKVRVNQGHWSVWWLNLSVESCFVCHCSFVVRNTIFIGDCDWSAVLVTLIGEFKVLIMSFKCGSDGRTQSLRSCCSWIAGPPPTNDINSLDLTNFSQNVSLTC